MNVLLADQRVSEATILRCIDHPATTRWSPTMSDYHINYPVETGLGP